MKGQNLRENKWSEAKAAVNDAENNTLKKEKKETNKWNKIEKKQLFILYTSLIYDNRNGV